MLFNKTSNGAEELKNIIGFIQASIDFDNMQTYIKFAESDIKKIIGTDIYTLAQQHYLSDNFGEEDTEGSSSGSGLIPNNELLNELVEKIQTPVAFHAYISYASSNDLTHSDKGRQIFVSENEKPAFEWMVQRDEDNILALAYKATDDLLDFLMEHMDYFPEWTSSQSYKDARELFINRAEDFDRIFPIDKSRRLFILLTPFIRECERKFIRPVLGESAFSTIKTAILDGNLTDAQETLLEYVNVPLVLYTMATAVTRLSLKVLPHGICEQYIESKSALVASRPAERSVKTEFMATIMREADTEMKRLQEYIAKTDAEEAGETYTPTNSTDRHSASNKYFRA